MKDRSSGNYACQGLGAFSCVFSDEQMPRGSEEVFVETHVYRDTEEDEATLERESVMGVFEEDAVDTDAIPLDLSDGVDVSEEESDFEPEEPGSLIHSLCNWALTFGVSLIALTALLGLLRFYHPDLPKDARTLLRMKTDLSIQKRCGGLYYYFGFLSSIKNMLSQATESIVDGFTLKLQNSLLHYCTKLLHLFSRANLLHLSTGNSLLYLFVKAKLIPTSVNLLYLCFNVVHVC
ncbi:hypothetical protein AOLI_G00324060 [Acnodon oligacanthus]